MEQVKIQDIYRLISTVVGGRLSLNEYSASMPLLGGIPEFDSIAVTNLVMSMEEEYNITVYDDELSESIFLTPERLLEYLRGKVHPNSTDQV